MALPTETLPADEGSPSGILRSIRVIRPPPFDSPGTFVVGGSKGRTSVEVRVELKPGIFDAEADSVRRSLELLGIPHVTRVTTARVYHLEFDGVDDSEAEKLAARAVDRLLANPVIHQVRVSPPPG